MKPLRKLELSSKFDPDALWGLDTETTGVSLHHGCKPFFVATCNLVGEQNYWEWRVDPLTREPIIPEGDLEEVNQIPYKRRLVLQNPKFDVIALDTLRWEPNVGEAAEELGVGIWDRIDDTLTAGHILASGEPHDLTSMAQRYLSVDVAPYEDRLEVACVEARRIARTRFPTWAIARDGFPVGAKGGGGKRTERGAEDDTLWKWDTWLPRLVAEELGYPDDHPWHSVLREYGLSDPATTIALWLRQKEILIERGLWGVYCERRKLLRITTAMENRGVTCSVKRLEELDGQYQEEIARSGNVCVRLSNGLLEEMPVGTTDAVREVLTGVYGLKPHKNTKKGNPSFDKDVLKQWEDELPPTSKARLFVKNLRGHRKRVTARGFMKSYLKIGVPIEGADDEDSWLRLYSSLNPTGTNTLRGSSYNPNGQQISKQDGFNLRYLFGPAPGREWWSLDYSNIELRIPAYEAQEEAMVELFERPNDPPFYGSYHMLIFATLHPEKFAKHAMASKKVYEATWYQWTKNGDFAVGYGSVEESGTADRAYHMPGAFRRVKKLFKRIHGPGGLNEQMIDHANRYGFVWTMPDKRIGTGYPIQCLKGVNGRVKPTIPLNYHVQSTAMYAMGRAMVRCQEYLDRLNEARGFDDYFIILQIHDEMVFDFPAPPPTWKKAAHLYNLPKMKRIKCLMEQSGDDIGVPLVANLSYHPVSWDT